MLTEFTNEDAIKILADWKDKQPAYQGEDARSVHYARNRAALEMAIEALSGCELVGSAKGVLIERQRQITGEGWSAWRDDEYKNGELAKAAAMYAIASHRSPTWVARNWPGAERWWKPKTERQNLIRAGALILAELDRIGRLANKETENG